MHLIPSHFKYGNRGFSTSKQSTTQHRDSSFYYLLTREEPESKRRFREP